MGKGNVEHKLGADGKIRLKGAVGSHSTLVRAANESNIKASTVDIKSNQNTKTTPKIKIESLGDFIHFVDNRLIKLRVVSGYRKNKDGSHTKARVEKTGWGIWDTSFGKHELLLLEKLNNRIELLDKDVRIEYHIDLPSSDDGFKYEKDNTISFENDKEFIKLEFKMCNLEEVLGEGYGFYFNDGDDELLTNTGILTHQLAEAQDGKELTYAEWNDVENVLRDKDVEWGLVEFNKNGKKVYGYIYSYESSRADLTSATQRINNWHYELTRIRE